MGLALFLSCPDWLTAGELDTVSDPSAAFCPYRFGAQWGYITKEGVVAIPFQFAQARDFSPFGLARVKQDGKWGFIDASGAVVVACAYDDAGDFAVNGLTPVRLGDKWGYIDAAGQVVLPFELMSAGSFGKNGLATVSRMSAKYQGSVDTVNMNAKGQKFRLYSNAQVAFGDNGMILVSDDNDKYGFVDAAGDLVIAFRYDAAEGFGPTPLAKVGMGGERFSKKGAKWGFINEQGEEVVPLIYDEIEYRAFYERDYARVKRGDKVGYLNLKGEEAIPVQFEDVSLSKDGATLLVKRNGKWGVETLGGEVIVPHRYETLGDFGDRGVAFFKRDGKMGLLDREYREVVPPIYESLGRIADRGVLPAKKDGKYGFIDVAGAVVADFLYDAVYTISPNGMVAVGKGKKWGFIDLTRKGEVAVPLKYDATSLDGFGDNGLAPVKLGDKWGYVDTRGNEVIPPKYWEAKGFGVRNMFGELYRKRDIERRRQLGTATPEDAPDFQRFDVTNYAQVSLTRHDQGYIDAQGNQVVPLRFNSVSDIDDYGWTQVYFNQNQRNYNGLVHVAEGWMVVSPPGRYFGGIRDFAKSGLVRVRRDGMYGYVDVRGDIVISVQFDAAVDFSSSGLAMVERNGVARCIDATGGTVVREEWRGRKVVLKNAREETVWPKP